MPLSLRTWFPVNLFTTRRESLAMGEVSNLGFVGIIKIEAPQLATSLREMKEGLDVVRSKVEALTAKVKANSFLTADGISYLEAKHLLLRSYCQCLVYYLLRKAKRFSIDGHPVVRSLLEIRMFLEKIPITSAPTNERDEIGFSTPYSKTSTPFSRKTTTPQSGMASATNPGMTPPPSLGLEQTPRLQFGVLAIRSSSLDPSCQTGLMDIGQYTESLKQKHSTYEAHQVEIDERLKCLDAEQTQAEQELITLQGNYYLG